jgi:hypothetical protein
MPPSFEGEIPMNLGSKSVVRILGVFLVVITACWPALASEIPLVKPPVELETAKFVPGELMKGKVYHVRPTAVNDGYVTTYTLETEWGELKAVSDYRLRVRIQEAKALKTLDEMSRAGVFGDALVEGALAPINAVVDLVTDPVNTVSDAAEGMGQWFGNVANALTSDDPHQEGAVSAAVGWAGTKRAFAVELGVDPYTDWEPLQEALASVGRAAFAGGITAKVAMSKASEDTALATPVLVLSLAGTARQMLIDNPPERLAELHRTDLVELGIPEEVIEPFLENYHYSPLEKLQLVEALKRMKGADGLDIYVAHAAAAPNKGVARYMQQRTEMMAKFHEEISPASFVRLKEVPLQKTPDGRVIGLFPLDYVPWTADLEVIVRAMSQEVDQLGNVTSKELWFEGTVSPEARKGMEAHGWVVKEDVQLLIAAF